MLKSLRKDFMPNGLFLVRQYHRPRAETMRVGILLLFTPNKILSRLVLSSAR